MRLNWPNLVWLKNRHLAVLCFVNVFTALKDHSFQDIFIFTTADVGNFLQRGITKKTACGSAGVMASAVD